MKEREMSPASAASSSEDQEKQRKNGSLKKKNRTNEQSSQPSSQKVLLQQLVDQNDTIITLLKTLVTAITENSSEKKSTHCEYPHDLPAIKQDSSNTIVEEPVREKKDSPRDIPQITKNKKQFIMRFDSEPVQHSSDSPQSNTTVKNPPKSKKNGSKQLPVQVIPDRINDENSIGEENPFLFLADSVKGKKQ